MAAVHGGTHAGDRRAEPCVQRLADQEMADVELDDLMDRRNLLGGRIIEPMAGTDLDAGTGPGAWGLVRSAIAVISGVAAISKLSGAAISALRRTMSSSRICRRSSRKCAVMPAAPAAMAILAAWTGSGWMPPRALRSVAT